MFPLYFFPAPFILISSFLSTFFRISFPSHLAWLLFTDHLLLQTLEPGWEAWLKRDGSVLLLIKVDWNATRVVLPRCVGVQAMQPALCIAQCTSTPSPTIMSVTSTQFTRLSTWSGWSYTPAHIPFPNRKRRGPYLQICTHLACTSGTSRRRRAMRPNKPPAALTASSPAAGRRIWGD